MGKLSCIVLISAVALLGALHDAAAIWPFDDKIVVDTSLGKVKGRITDDKKVAVFHDVPFGRPPVGDYRLRSALPVDPWTDTKDCSSAKPLTMCKQELKGIVVGDEDCLYLHIYTPTTTPDEPLPVMFWIFGGAYTMGDGYELDLYNGNNLASEHNAVVVAANYRVGSLGFLALNALQETDPSHITGNYGLTDQLRAMEWVQHHISNFGGDPSRVTIFGESAGAFSVCAHIASPLSSGLFHSAIMESTTCVSSNFFRDLPHSNAFGLEMAAAVGCENETEVVECLQKVDVDKLVKVELPPYTGSGIDQRIVPPLYGSMDWGTVIDGVFLLDVPLSVMERGEHNQVPIIIGMNKDEGTLLLPDMAAPIGNGVKYPFNTKDTLIGLHQLFHIDALPMYEHYEREYNTTDSTVLGPLMFRDFVFSCPIKKTAIALAKSEAPVYVYYFDYPLRWLDGKKWGNYHTSELVFVFDNSIPLVHGFDSADKAMASSFGTAWSNLAKSGNPNLPVPLSTEWRPFSLSGEDYMHMNVPLRMDTNLNGDVCEWWGDVKVYWHPLCTAEGTCEV